MISFRRPSDSARESDVRVPEHGRIARSDVRNTPTFALGSTITGGKAVRGAPMPAYQAENDDLRP